MAGNRTAGGKQINIVSNGLGQYKIEFGSGGQLPAELTGMFTSQIFAQRAIDIYLAK